MYNINSTKNVPLANLPSNLQESWRNESENGNISLGLQKAYRLLYELGDDVGKKFVEIGWLTPPIKEDKENKQKPSPLEARNNSILAHGFDPVSKRDISKHLQPSGGVSKSSGSIERRP